MARSKVYDLLAIARLGSGPNPVPPETIQKLGRIKAAEIARLSPEDRSPELLHEALAHSVPAARRRVQENMSLPCYLERVRDGDRTLTLRAKFMLALIVNFEMNFEPELAEADSYLEAIDGKEAVPNLRWRRSMSERKCKEMESVRCQVEGESGRRSQIMMSLKAAV